MGDGLHEGFLHDIVGICRRPGDAIAQAPQKPSVFLEPLRQQTIWSDRLQLKDFGSSHSRHLPPAVVMAPLECL